MNVNIIKQLLDKDLILVLLYSFINYIYINFVLLVIKYSKDDQLFFIDSKIKLNSNSELDDLLSDSDSDTEYNNLSNIDTLESYNTHLKLWEYEIILRIFHIPNILLNILNDNEINKIPVIYNNHNNLNSYVNNNLENTIIVDSFLFNIDINKNSLIKKFNFNEDSETNKKNKLDINFKNIYSLKKKIILLYYLYSNLNSNIIHNLFPEYKYLYILYKKSENSYDYILVDLFNNYDLIKNKKILFNQIKL
jgi:hypothetical protein